jgi:hypothetical protein
MDPRLVGLGGLSAGHQPDVTLHLDGIKLMADGPRSVQAFCCCIRLAIMRT